MQPQPPVKIHMRPATLLDLNRPAIRAAVSRYRTANLRVFGSVLHGTDQEGSDLDLLVDALSDLHHLAALPAEIGKLLHLMELDLSFTDITDLAPLATLPALQSLDCSNTQVSDLAPLATLPVLKELSIHNCQIQYFPPSLIWNQSFEKLDAHNATIPQIPPEVLSQHWGDNCLPRLRAHLRDLEAGATAITSAKLMLLGNGTVGKTQLCRRLRNLAFDPAIPSTHGVQVQSITHPQGEWHV